MQNKIILALHSRTVWTTAILFIYFGLVGIAHVIPNATVVNEIVGLLGFILITYFHVTPSQNYTSQ